MERIEAIESIREACKKIAVEMMRIHPALPGLKDQEAQGEIIKALFETTRQVEAIKKRLARLESKDDSSLT